MSNKRLNQVYEKAERLPMDRCTKIVCMSDCHRGVGNHGDNFLPNQNIFFAALQFYYDRGFTYIEVGDGDELWENRSLKKIVNIHSDTFWLLSKFYQSCRFHMLFGNHDCKKKDMKYTKRHCDHYYCDSKDVYCELLQGIQVKEGIVLQDCTTGHELFLVHGHQGDLLNDYLWPIARFLVRYVWRALELLGVEDPTSAAQNYKRRKKTERRLERWAEKNQVMILAGHTHRPELPKPGEGLYCNDGSCVHPRCITAMEIEYGKLTLVKWSVLVRHGRMLSVEREVLEGPTPFADYWSPN